MTSTQLGTAVVTSVVTVIVGELIRYALHANDNERQVRSGALNVGAELSTAQQTPALYSIR